MVSRRPSSFCYRHLTQSSWENELKHTQRHRFPMRHLSSQGCKSHLHFWMGEQGKYRCQAWIEALFQSTLCLWPEGNPRRVGVEVNYLYPSQSHIPVTSRATCAGFIPQHPLPKDEKSPNRQKVNCEARSGWIS